MLPENFSFIFKNGKIKFYNRISKNAIVINALLLLIFCFSSTFDNRSKVIAAISAAIVLISLLIVQKFYPFKKKWGVGYVIIFDLLTVTWVLLGYYWIAGIQLVFSFLSAFAVKKVGVAFYIDRIIIYSLAERKILWNQLNNVVLKDGLLTIDFKNNKIIQQEIDDQTSSVNEKEFNDFCRHQLSQ